MQLCVLQGDWGETQPAYLEEVLKDAASHINRLLDDPFEGNIIIKSCPEDQDPKVHYRNSSDDPFCISLSVRDSRWNQFAFQFSHEFCHVLSNYEHLRANPNNWLHEAICELASVFTLRRMAERWLTDPPYCNGAGYSVYLKQYVDRRLSRPAVQLPNGITLQDWLSSEEESLRNCKYQRKKNAVVAYILLSIFEDAPEGWNAIRCLPNSTTSLEEYFVDWHSEVNAKDKPFIERLAQVFCYTI